MSDTLEQFEAALNGEHIREAKLAVGEGLARAFGAVRMLNSIREGELCGPDAHRWTLIGAAEFLGTDPESIRQGMVATGTRYVLVLDNVGHLDNAGLLAVARWLRDRCE